MRGFTRFITYGLILFSLGCTSAVPPFLEPLLTATAAARSARDASGSAFSEEPVPSDPCSAGDCQPSLDRADVNSVIGWLNYALEAGDLEAVEMLLRPDDITFAYYLEGGQSVSHAEFLDQLSTRLASRPACEGYSLEEGSLQIWTSGWQPNWEMTESCYIDGCSQLDPPRSSAAAGFLFGNQSGEWQLGALYLNTPDKYYFADWPLTACTLPAADLNQPTPGPRATSASASSSDGCPAAPPQRLVVGEQAHVCTQFDRVLLRSGPGRSYDELHRYEPGSTLDVIGGPTCSDSWSWWEVIAPNGHTGWMTEGGDSEDPYFLCPGP